MTAILQGTAPVETGLTRNLATPEEALQVVEHVGLGFQRMTH